MQRIGVDIVEIPRIETVVGRWGQSFLRRVYTEPELKLYGNRSSSLAARFSGKEAVIKALGAGGIGFNEIEILADDSGKPEVRLYGKALRQAENIGLLNIDISLSHCKEYAVACAIAETKD